MNGQSLSELIAEFGCDVLLEQDGVSASFSVEADGTYMEHENHITFITDNDCELCINIGKEFEMIDENTYKANGITIILLIE